MLKALRRSFRVSDSRSWTDEDGGERQKREAGLIRRAAECRRLAAKFRKEAERTKLKLAHEWPKWLF
jgi:hypothetical protein